MVKDKEVASSEISVKIGGSVLKIRDWEGVGKNQSAILRKLYASHSGTQLVKVCDNTQLEFNPLLSAHKELKDMVENLNNIKPLVYVTASVAFCFNLKNGSLNRKVWI